MNYYDETLIKIKTLIQEQKLGDALKIIDDELSLPYVPLEFETQLKALKAELEVQVNPEPIKLTGEQIFSLLNDQKVSSEEKYGLMLQLDSLNLRTLLTPINEFLTSKVGNELKTTLIYLLAVQEVDHEFSYEVNHQMIQINPKTFDFKKVEMVPLKLVEIMEKILPHIYPQLLEMSKYVVSLFYTKLFPSLEGYDLEKLGQAIKNRLLTVNQIDEIKVQDELINQYEKLLIDLEIV